MHLRFSAVTLLLFLAVPALTQSQDEGVSRLLKWDQLSEFTPGSQVHLFSSHSRQSSNYPPPSRDGNKDSNNFIAVCGGRLPLPWMVVDHPVPRERDCPQDAKGYLLAHLEGQPGYIARMWMTSQFHSDAQIKIYIDGQKTPIISVNPNLLGEGEAYPFQSPLAEKWSGAAISYVPISFRDSVHVLLEPMDAVSFDTFFYQVGVVTHSNQETETFSPNNFKNVSTGADFVVSWVKSLFDHPRREGGFHELLIAQGSHEFLNVTGTGTIKEISFRLPKKLSPKALENVWLRLYFNQNEKPAVDVPLVNFFSQFVDWKLFNSIPLSVREESSEVVMTSYWPMPFQDGMRAVLVNLDEKPLELAWSAVLDRSLPSAESGVLSTYFNSYDKVNGARYSVAPHELYTVIDVQSRGKFVGNIMHFEGHLGLLFPPFQNFQLVFLEGDDFLSIDDDPVPRWKGTGIEDYFNGAFYFEQAPLNGLFQGILERSTSPTSGVVTAYRWHMLSDEVVFNESLKLQMEYGQDAIETVDQIKSIAIYYR